MTELLLAAMQVSVILLVALGALSLLAKRSAALRHAVIATALSCSAIVPLLSEVVPPWITQRVAMPAMADVMTAAVRPDAAIRTPQARLAENQTAPAPGGQLSRPVSDRLTHDSARTDWVKTAGGVYRAGLVIALGLLALELLRGGWLAARSRPMSAGAWLKHRDDIARSFGLRRRVLLKQSPHPALLATWGFLQPLVLLPADAGHWPEARIRAVLLHELAHVRRNDWLIQLLAALLRAVYWFNPLIWIACRRLRLESELACDDAVLARGVRETDYAGELLALARSMSRPPVLLGPAPSMARRSTLQLRVANVLDAAVVRAGATRASLVRMALFMLLLTCVVAACGRARSPRPAAMAAPVLPGERVDPPVTPETPVMEARTQIADEGLQQPPQATGSAGANARPGSPAEAASPQQIAAGILALVRDAQADELTGMLDEITRPITGLRHVERYALAVVNDDGRDPAVLAANCVEIVNALMNTGNLAANIRRQPGAARLPAAPFERLGAALHAKAAQLSGVLMPVPASKAPVASTPESRAAATAQELARMALRDVAFVGSRPASWLVTELDTLERAATAVLDDQGGGGGASRLRLHVLHSSIRSTIRQANQMAGRADRAAANPGKAAALVASLQDVAGRLHDAMIHLPHKSSRDPLAAVMARVAEDMQELQLVTLRRSGDTFIALLGNRGSSPINIMIEEAGSEVEAIRSEERLVISTPVAGVVEERNGMRLNSWGGEGEGSGYRVQARVGTRVVNVAAPPELSHFVLPILDRIVVQLRWSEVP